MEYLFTAIFLRPSNIDHQEMAQMEQSPYHEQMEPLFNELGMVKTINPMYKKYDHVFIYGGTPEHTKARFTFLAHNIKCNNIVPIDGTVVYINGRRKLAKTEILEAKAMGIDCVYQHECAKLMWKKYFKELPVSFKMITIDPPKERRANSEDTLVAFFAEVAPKRDIKFLFGHYTKKQRILGFSNQPYVPYQGDIAKAVAETENRADLNIEVVGQCSDKPVATIIYLDSIARRVYTTNMVQSFLIDKQNK